LPGHGDAHAVLDAGGHLDGDGAARAHGAVAAARPARRGDDGAGAAATRAGPRRHHLAEQRARDGLDLTAALALRTGVDVRARSRARTVAGLAEDRGVERELLLDAERGLSEVELHADQRIVA